jgi:hypothetical protein
MKSLQKLLLGSVLLSGLLFAWTGCETDGSVDGSVYYGPSYRDRWFRDDNWMDGTRGYRERPNRDNRPEKRSDADIYISPPRIPAPPAPPGLHLN